MVNYYEYISLIDAEYRPHLKHTDVAHDKFMILFSGPSGSGKSTAARYIEDHFEAIRLENDAIRRIVRRLVPDVSHDDCSRITYAYLDYLMQDLQNSCANQRWVIDASIDRRYEAISQWTDKNGFPTVIIAMKTAKQERINRLEVRIAANRESFDADIYSMNEQHENDQANFLAQHSADITLEPHYNFADLSKKITEKLTKR